MFGRLPQLHRTLLVAVALLVCVGAGAWLAYMTPLPLVWTTGALLGAGLGVVTAYLLLHEPRSQDVSRRR